MTLCDDGHDEVCYEANKCPCCEAIKESERIDRKLGESQEEVGTLESEVAFLKAKIKSLESFIQGME